MFIFIFKTYSRQECTPNTVYLDEHTIYGSKRLGVRNYPGVGQSNRVSLDNVEVPNDQILYKREIFAKHYEVSDHLGNVRAVIGDTKWDAGGGIFRPNVITYSNYYPFGMAQPGRNLNSADYKFGYNGKEKDDEIKGSGNSYDYGFRMYDPRVAKFLSIDPLAAEYPWYTPFQFAGNKPIRFIDLDGKEEYDPFAALISQGNALVWNFMDMTEKGAKAVTDFFVSTAEDICILYQWGQSGELVKYDPITKERIQGPIYDFSGNVVSNEQATMSAALQIIPIKIPFAGKLGGTLLRKSLAAAEKIGFMKFGGAGQDAISKGLHLHIGKTEVNITLDEAGNLAWKNALGNNLDETTGKILNTALGSPEFRIKLKGAAEKVVELISSKMSTLDASQKERVQKNLDAAMELVKQLTPPSP